jgi:hypothetical protein
VLKRNSRKGSRVLQLAARFPVAQHVRSRQRSGKQNSPPTVRVTPEWRCSDASTNIVSPFCPRCPRTTAIDASPSPPRTTIDAGAPTRPTPCLPTLGAGCAAPQACAALDAVRVLATKQLSRTRDVPPRRSYPHVRRAPPPTASLPPHQSPPRWSVACAICRDYQRHRLSWWTLYSTATPRAITHATTKPLHAARDVLRDCDIASFVL